MNGIMWKQTTKPPAWVSLTDVCLPKFVPATQEEIDALQEVLGDGLGIERMELGGRHLHMYRVKNYSMGGELLIKWLPSERYDEARETYELSYWLSERGFSTPYPILEPCQLNLYRGGLIYGISYHRHRLLRPTPEDMQALAISLVQIHDILPRHEKYGQWRQNTEKRLSLLASIRNDLANGKLRSGPDPDRLREIASDKRLDFIRNDMSRQSLHGDLNFRNAFVPLLEGDQVNSSIMVLDFEDVKHSVLPVVFELALVIERFIMVHALKNEKIITLARIFLSNYKERCIHRMDLEAVDWVNVIQSLNLRSLCVLSLIESQGGIIPSGEWYKFFYLFDIAERQAELWRRIAGADV